RVLRRFLQHPDALLQKLTEFRGIIGGTSALAFLMRDLSVSSDVLQIYVPAAFYRPMLDGLASCMQVASEVHDFEEVMVPRYMKTERDISAKAILRLKNGLRIVLYGALRNTACAPIARSPLSAFTSFVTDHTFGCGYPILTLHRRALFSDLRLMRMDAEDHELFAALCRAGFSIAVTPTAWKEFRPSSTATTPTRPNSHFCSARWYVCPMQGRFFGDGGSLVGLLDPLGQPGSLVQASGIPPFGPMVAWRLSTSFECAEFCDVRDPVLHEWLVSSAFVFV
ncbi:hypothetical protein C8Q76DRAFT_577850, partial [Earliella scabrosa]